MRSLRAPAELAYGWGALERLSSLTGREAALFIDSNCRDRLLDRAVDSLEQAGLRVRVLDGLAREPTYDSVAQVRRELRGAEPDLYVAIGGGSVLDAAKMARVAAELPRLSPEEWFAFGALDKPAWSSRLVAVPTTSGTGSEVTCAAVLIDPASRLKRVAIAPSLVPQLAIVDPELPLSMPPQVTACSGFDALVHALEAWTCRLASELTRPLAVGAARLLLRHLEPAWRDGADREARERVHYAATLAGLAISNSSVGLAHSLDQVGPLFDLPHGLALAILYPYVLDYNLRESEADVAELARLLGLGGGTDGESAARLRDAVRGLAARLGLPATLREAGVPWPALEAELDRLTAAASAAFATRQNPREPAPGHLHRLIACAYRGEPVDF